MGLIKSISNFFVRNRYQKEWFPQLQDAVWNGRRSTRLDKIRKTWGGVIVKSFFSDAVGHSKNFYNRKISPVLFSKKNISSNSLKKAAVVVAGVGLSILGFVAVKRFFFQAASAPVSNSTVLSGGIGISPEFLPNAASAVKGLISSLQASLPSLATSSAGLSNGVVVISVLALAAFLVHRSRNSSRVESHSKIDEDSSRMTSQYQRLGESHRLGESYLKNTQQVEFDQNEESRSSSGNSNASDKQKPRTLTEIRKHREVNLHEEWERALMNGDVYSYLNRAGDSFEDHADPADSRQPSFDMIMSGYLNLQNR